MADAIGDIYRQFSADDDHAPEGESFFVVTSDKAAALAVAPKLAAILRPGVRFGAVLMVEQQTEVEVSGFEVVLEVLPAKARPAISKSQNGR